MCIRGEVSTVADETELWVKGQLATRFSAVLDQLVLADRGHELAPAATHGKQRLVLLAEGLHAVECRLDHKLRDVRPQDVTVARDELPAEQIAGCDGERELIILTAVEE